MKTIRALPAAAAAALACGQAAASGIPVVDLTAAANFIVNLEQLVKEYSMLENQYAKQVQQYTKQLEQHQQQVEHFKSVSGVWGFFKNNFSAANINIVTSTLKSSFDSVLNNGWKSMTSEAKTAFDSSSLGAACVRKDSMALDTCLRIQALKAQYVASLACADEVAQKMAAEIEADYAELAKIENTKGHSEQMAKILLRQNSIQLAQLNLLREIARQKSAIDDAEKAAAARAGHAVVTGQAGE